MKKNHMLLFDISPPLDENYAIWPTDMPLKKIEKLSLKKGHCVNLSALQATTHLGAHTDAPYLSDDSKPSVGDMDLNYFIGEAQVIEVNAKPLQRISSDIFSDEIKAKRVLFKTNTANDLKIFPEDYAALSEECIKFLHDKGVILIGIDTPGVDLFKDCSKIPCHKLMTQYNMASLQCLWLKDVKPGIYELVALPLKLMGFEASPVRAVLRK